MRKEAVNTFADGLLMDISPINMPKTALSDCLNGTYLTYNGNEMSLQNDMGNYRLKGSELNKNFMPIGVASYGDILYVISYNPLTEESEIGSFPSPNHTISADLDNSLRVESILTQAFAADKITPGSVTWTKKSLEETFGKEFVFYQVNNQDLTISPGDYYTIKDVPSLGNYEELAYSIFNDSESYKIEPIVDGQEHPVSWESSGYLRCKFTLPKIDNTRIVVTTLDIPTVYQTEDDTFDTNDNTIRCSAILSFQSDDKVINDALANGGKAVTIKYDVYVDDTYVYSDAITEGFNVLDFGGQKTYSKNVNIQVPFNLNKEIGKNINDNLIIKASLIMNASMGDDKAEVFYEEVSEKVYIKEAYTLYNVTIGSSIFKYHYEGENLHILTDLGLTSYLTSGFRLTYELGTIDCNLSPQWLGEADALSYYNPLTKRLDINAGKVNPDFYVVRFTVIKGEGEAPEHVYHFMVADPNVTARFYSEDDFLYPVFDRDIQGDEIFAAIPAITSKNVVVDNVSDLVVSNDEQYTAYPECASEYIQPSARVDKLLMDNDLTHADFKEAKSYSAKATISWEYDLPEGIFSKQCSLAPSKKTSTFTGKICQDTSYDVATNTTNVTLCEKRNLPGLVMWLKHCYSELESDILKGVAQNDPKERAKRWHTIYLTNDFYHSGKGSIYGEPWQQGDPLTTNAQHRLTIGGKTTAPWTTLTLKDDRGYSGNGAIVETLVYTERLGKNRTAPHEGINFDGLNVVCGPEDITTVDSQASYISQFTHIAWKTETSGTDPEYTWFPCESNSPYISRIKQLIPTGDTKTAHYLTAVYNKSTSDPYAENASFTENITSLKYKGALLIDNGINNVIKAAFLELCDNRDIYSANLTFTGNLQAVVSADLGITSTTSFIGVDETLKTNIRLVDSKKTDYAIGHTHVNFDLGLPSDVQEGSAWWDFMRSEQGLLQFNDRNEYVREQAWSRMEDLTSYGFVWKKNDEVRDLIWGKVLVKDNPMDILVNEPYFEKLKIRLVKGYTVSFTKNVVQPSNILDVSEFNAFTRGQIANRWSAYEAKGYVGYMYKHDDGTTRRIFRFTIYDNVDIRDLLSHYTEGVDYNILLDTKLRWETNLPEGVKVNIDGTYRFTVGKHMQDLHDFKDMDIYDMSTENTNRPHYHDYMSLDNNIPTDYTPQSIVVENDEDTDPNIRSLFWREYLRRYKEDPNTWIEWN